MSPTLIPSNEVERIVTLQSYSILDTQPEKNFDDITKRAAQICNTPIAGICLVDEERVWFKSLYGIDIQPIPRKIAFCTYAILNPNEPFVVIDARSDSRFANNPSVTGHPHIVFYFGIPLVCPKGNALGTLCVIDHTPRVLTKHQVEMMKALALQTMAYIKLNKLVVQ
jgi:GAF domain-containing protein